MENYGQRLLGVKAAVRKSLKFVNVFFRAHPYLCTVLISFLYLIVFQYQFVTSGDIWAEAFYEYVYGAVIAGWNSFFHPGIAGYFNFLPKIFSYTYVLAGFPMQGVDYFLRIVTIVYAVGCVGFIAHSYNRHIIKNDYIRSVLAVAVLMTYYHVSSFSFINVWYVGFIPIILVSISPKKIKSDWRQLLYAGFAMAVCLSKPSLILLPLVIYRAFRHKEYLLAAIISFAITLQTLLFLTSSYFQSQPDQSHVSIFSKLANSVLYIGLLFLKLFEIRPVSAAMIVLAAIFVFLLIIFAIKILGYIRTVLLSVTMLLASYTAIYSPDAAIVSVRKSYEALFFDVMKLQREVIIYFFLLLFLYIFISSINRHVKTPKKYENYVLAGTLIIAILVPVRLYRNIDTVSSNIYVNIDPFRQSIQDKEPVCMPIPPTFSWVPYGFTAAPVHGWYYESQGLGTCEKTNYEKTIDYTSFNNKIAAGIEITVVSQGNKKQIKSIVIPISNETPNVSKTVVLENKKTGARYYAEMTPRQSKDPILFVAFNLNKEPASTSFEYVLREEGNSDSTLKTGTFTDGQTTVFAYLL